jgi:hypothetical protein
LNPRSDARAGSPKSSEIIKIDCAQIPQWQSDNPECSIVLFDDSLERLIVDKHRVRTIPMTSGDELIVIDLLESERVQMSSEGIVIRDEGDQS